MQYECFALGVTSLHTIEPLNTKDTQCPLSDEDTTLCSGYVHGDVYKLHTSEIWALLLMSAFGPVPKCPECRGVPIVLFNGLCVLHEALLQVESLAPVSVGVCGHGGGV